MSLKQNNTNKILFYITHLQHSTYYTRHYLLTKPRIKLLDYLQCAILLTYITYTILHNLTYGFITYFTYVIFLTYTRHLHWKHSKTKFKPSKSNACSRTACINLWNRTTSLKTYYGCLTIKKAHLPMTIRWFRVEQEDQSLSTPYMTLFLERFRVFVEIDWYHSVNSDQKELAQGHDTNKWLTVWSSFVQKGQWGFSTFFILYKM